MLDRDISGTFEPLLFLDLTANLTDGKTKTYFVSVWSFLQIISLNTWVEIETFEPMLFLDLTANL